MKLLFLDIETSPNVCYTWGLHHQDISPNQIITPSSILCWSAQWYGEKQQIFFSRRTGFNAMIKAAHKVLEAADAVCHYNGNGFDIPRLNQEFLRLSLTPPAPAQQIDLLRVAQSRFGLPSNKLEFVAPYFGIGAKVKHPGMELWTGCINNDAASWKLMETYNKQDVALLVKLYEKLLPWIPNHPNMNHFVDGKERCCTNWSFWYDGRRSDRGEHDRRW